MPDHDNPFSPPYTLTAIELRRALQHLARHRLAISVIGGEPRAERSSNVAGAGESGRNAVIVEHPAGAPAEQPVFAEGDALELRWSESGVRYGAQARVLRLVAGEPPSYELEVQPQVQRLERRKTERVPIESDEDGVRAELRLDGDAAPLAATLRNLSADGCRLALPAQAAHAAGIAAGAQARLSLALPGGAAQQGRLLVLHVEHGDEHVLEFGASWVAPEADFIDRIARFVAIKQHALQHRRAAR